jgi:hypothetical protein
MGNGGQAVKYFIHYRPDNGEIIGWGNGFDPVPIEGMAVAMFDQPIEPDPLTQKITDGELVNKSADEQRLARLPSLREMRVAIFQELQRTDAFMIADRTVAARDAWAGYRQMLRDLSKRFEQPVDMINAWDEPPDGLDPIPELRARL